MGLDAFPKPSPSSRQGKIRDLGINSSEFEARRDNPRHVSLTTLVPYLDTKNIVEIANSEDARAIDNSALLKYQGDVSIADTPYSSQLLHKLNELRDEKDSRFEALRKLFEGEIVVDLGAGNSDQTPGFRIAALLGADYIGVEPLHTFRFTDHMDFHTGNPDTARSWTKEITTKYAVAGEDMLRFLRRLPDRSVNILVSGIDENIMPQGAYALEVQKEIRRVMKKAAIFYDSDPLYSLSGAQNAEGIEDVSMHISGLRIMTRKI